MSRFTWERLDWRTFGPELDGIVQAAINQVHRERPGPLRGNEAATLLIESILRITDNTHRTIRFLVADTPKLASRKPEFALSAGPLARTILDSLFTVIFAFQDLPARTEWYLKAGWRETYEEHERMVAAYSADARFADWLKESQEQVDATRAHCGVSDDEAKAPSLVHRWPTPGQMLKSKVLDDERRAFLTHLDAWFYKSLSAESHLSWPGLALRGAPLVADLGEDREAVMDKRRSDALTVTVLLVLSLVSEVNHELGLGLSTRLAYVWTIQREFAIAAQELWDLRYETSVG